MPKSITISLAFAMAFIIAPFTNAQAAYCGKLVKALNGGKCPKTDGGYGESNAGPDSDVQDAAGQGNRQKSETTNKTPDAYWWPWGNSK